MFLRRFMTVLISVILVYEQSIFAAVAIGPEERPEDIGTVILNSDRPSDLPVAGFSEYFDRENINIFSNIDLSQYQGMKIFAGYGIYDKDQKECHFVEVPGKDKLQFDQTFMDYKTYNKHSYAKTRNRMTYSECLATTAEFGGTPVVIDTSSENYFVRRNYIDGANIWVGATKEDCSSPYKNALHRPQYFFNFETEDICRDDQKNIAMNQYGYWERVNESQIFDCVVEWDTMNYLRPIKVCAPWWKVYREYKNEDMGLYAEKELKRINQADIPVKLSVCTKYSQDAVEQLQTLTGRDVTCTTYYSATVAPECLFDMKQPQCFVDECGGYIKNACRKKGEEIVGKGYVKGQVVIQGEKKSIKIKDEVKTNLFSCPPSPPSMSECLEKNIVLIFPKECPGSQCESLKSCLYAAQTDEEIKNCEDSYTCTKIYAGRDIPPKLAADGTVLEMYGKCPTETQDILTFYPSLLESSDKKCLEYEQLEVTKLVHERCVTERSYEDHEVNVGLTDTDIYQNDPNCLRIDTVEDSQIKTAVTMNITQNGFFRHRASKVFVDGHSEPIYEGGSDALIQSIINSDRDSVSSSSSDSDQSTCNISLDCSPYISSTYIDRNVAVLLDGSAADSNIAAIIIESGRAHVNVYGLKDQAACDSYAVSHGFDQYVENTDFTVNPATSETTCRINLVYTAEDNRYSSISVVGSELQYNGAGSVTKQECIENALCVSGTYNESAFGTDYSSTATCNIVTGGSPSSYMEELKTIAGCSEPSVAQTDGSCDPAPTSGSAFTTLNGFESILVFEDYLTGEFGYYSNFVSVPPKSNEVKITTDQFTDKSLFPLVELSNIVDYQKYIASMSHVAYESKQVDIYGEVALGMAGPAGALGTSALGYGALSLIGGGGLTALTTYVVVALLTPSRDMDSQKTNWAIYKTVPQNNFFGKFETRSEVLSRIDLGYGQTIDANGLNWLYVNGNTNIPKMDPGDFVRTSKNLFVAKSALLKCSGYDNTNINLMTHPSEISIITGHPSCKWYDIYCEKADYYYWNKTNTVSKKVNTIYSGADNTVVILVPYKGSFTLKAYDKYGSIVGTVDLNDESFINSESEKDIKYAQVKFGKNMQIAPGVNSGAACVDDYMAEVGGGVSGAYYENGTTGPNIDCAKSNDVYVNDHAITEIEVIPGNMNGASFKYKLVRPLPFVNRVFLATLDKEQIRRYRCYNDFRDCSDSDFEER